MTFDPGAFYATLVGRRTARRLARVIAPTIPLGATQRIAAIGYPPPILSGLDPARVERLALFLTTAKPHRWPARPPNHAAAACPDALPLAPNLVDTALVVHALEHADDPAAVLDEVWRVLAPAGQLVLIVPNRLGRLPGREGPFARGHAWNEGDLDTLLGAARFEVRSQTTALGGLAPRVRFALAVKTDGHAAAMVGRADAVRVPAAVGLVPA